MRTLVVVALALLLSACAQRRSPDLHGITPCPAGTTDLLAPTSLQCWWTAPHGRWRTLSRADVHGALVVDVEAASPEDGEAIALRFAASHGGSFQEMLIYVRPSATAGSRTIRRVRWVRGGRLERLDFPATAGAR